MDKGTNRMKKSLLITLLVLFSVAMAQDEKIDFRTADIKFLNHLLEAENLVVTVAPPEADQIVEQCLRQVTHVAIRDDASGAMSL